jgi:hypothetical protein
LIVFGDRPSWAAISRRDSDPRSSWSTTDSRSVSGSGSSARRPGPVRGAEFLLPMGACALTPIACTARAESVRNAARRPVDWQRVQKGRLVTDHGPPISADNARDRPVNAAHTSRRPVRGQPSCLTAHYPARGPCLRLARTPRTLLAASTKTAGPLAAINPGDEQSLTATPGQAGPQVRPCDRPGRHKFPS